MTTKSMWKKPSFQSGRASVERAFQTEERVSANVSGRCFSDMLERQRDTSVAGT